MLIAKPIAGLIRNTRITLIALTSQEQSNIMLEEMLKIMKIQYENHQLQNVHMGQSNQEWTK